MSILHLRLSNAPDAHGWVSTQALALTAAPLARAADLSVAAVNAPVGQGAAPALNAAAVIHAAAQAPSAELVFQFYRAAGVPPLVPSSRFVRREHVARCAEDVRFFQVAPDAARGNYFHPLAGLLGR